MNAGSIVIALLLAITACRDPSPTRSAPPTTILDLDTATVKQLEALPGIGAVRARQIMASRNARGGHFESIDDLLAIDGLGKLTVDRIRPYVTVGPDLATGQPSGGGR